MPIDFPDNPTQGEVFTVGALSWTWDGSAWTSTSAREFTRIISENAPSDPIEGDEWYESNTGKLYIYFNDNWVQQLGFNPTKSIRSESANTALVSGDANQVIRFTGTSSQTLTVDDVLEVGDRVEVIQDNSGQVEFSSGSGVTLLSTSGFFFTGGQNSKVEVMCVAAGEYRLFGDLQLEVPDPEIQYLVIAGGGGGGAAGTNEGKAGGGGAGGYRSSVQGEPSGGGASAESVFSFDLSTNYTITVGAGGGGGPATGTGVSTNKGTSGNNSVFSSITAIAGGGGGAGSDENQDGLNGGSGGGAGTRQGDGSGGAGTSTQGFGGGDSTALFDAEFEDRRWAGGGGGASEAGDDAVSGPSGNSGKGGDGVSSSITGTAETRAGGGGGGDALAGAGGGGAGSAGNAEGENAPVNTGGGGGGAYSVSGSPMTYAGGSGGSGIVILRYPADYSITIGAGLTGTENTDGNFKYAEITAGTGNVSFS